MLPFWWQCISWKLNVAGQKVHNIFDLFLTINPQYDQLVLSFQSSQRLHITWKMRRPSLHINSKLIATPLTKRKMPCTCIKLLVHLWSDKVGFYNTIPYFRRTFLGSQYDSNQTNFSMHTYYHSCYGQHWTWSGSPYFIHRQNKLQHLFRFEDLYETWFYHVNNDVLTLFLTLKSC
jgi:hypothetical protein